MSKNQITTILFLILFFICGCSTAKKKTMPLTVPQQKEVINYKSTVRHDMDVKKEKITSVRKNKLTWDVIVFRDLRQIDLDNDGEKDIVAIYTPIFSLNCSGVKLIKINQDKGEVIFKKVFITPNTKFEIKKGVPMIIVRDINLFARLRAKKIYLWNGKTFIPKQYKL